MKEGRGGDNVVPFAKYGQNAMRPDPVDDTDTAQSAAFYQKFLDAGTLAEYAGKANVAAVRHFVNSLLDDTCKEPFAAFARSTVLHFVDADRFPLRDDFNAIVSTFSNDDRQTLLNCFWHRAELLKILSPGRVATLALKVSRASTPA